MAAGFCAFWLNCDGLASTPKALAGLGLYNEVGCSLFWVNGLSGLVCAGISSPANGRFVGVVAMVTPVLPELPIQHLQPHVEFQGLHYQSNSKEH